jgi:rhodanese-related sulfurtransferase
MAAAPAFVELSVLQVERALASGARIVDTRAQSAFGSAFLPGSLNIGVSPSSVNWLGMVLPAATDIIIVADSRDLAYAVADQFRRAGYDRLIGFVPDGVAGWALQGKPLDHLPQLTPASLKHVMAKYADHMVLDVRTDAEWAAGHIEGARHFPLPQLVTQGIDVGKGRHITTVCRSGYRSNVAGSFLKSQGYKHVFSLIGGMTAWTAANR